MGCQKSMVPVTSGSGLASSYDASLLARLLCEVPLVWPFVYLALRHELAVLRRHHRRRRLQSNRLRLRVAGARHLIGAVEVDGAAVLGAADDAVRLWADDPYCSPD
jgi:hypothetical protein